MWFRKIFPGNKALNILLITNSVILLAGATLGPIYAIYVEKVGGDLLDASLTSGVFAVVAGITVILSGKYADRMKQPELVIIAGYLIVGAGYLLYMFVDSIWFLLLVQIVLGFGEAIYNSPFDKLYSGHLDLGRSGEEWGLWEALRYFAIAIGAILGGFIVTRFGFNILFVLMAGLCFISAGYIYRLPRRVL